MVLRIRALLTALYVHQVQYVIFGSLGAIAYGANIVTGDMDICPATTGENLKAIANCLKMLDARPHYDPPYNSIEAVMSWKPDICTVENLDNRFMTKFGQLDIQPAPYGTRGNLDRFDYKMLKSRAMTFQFFGIPVKVAHIDDIVASKMSRKRAKDLQVEAELRRVQGLAHQGIVISQLEDYEIMVKELPIQTEL